MVNRKVTVAATQMPCTDSLHENIKMAEGLVREAALQGANIILLPELFETRYFCQEENFAHYQLAQETQNNAAVLHFQKIAQELDVVLPISFYEKKNHARYNSVAVIDADGAILGVYRKSHIPTGPGYEEKFYFNPGDTGFRVWDTKFAKIGVGICWDQWFVEAARCMVLAGAQILLYPTAIGSEPCEDVDSKAHWQICQQGHAAANIVPLVASNRVGTEVFGNSKITFYGSSFIANHTGEIVDAGDRESRAVLTHTFDLDEILAYRNSWGIFRDRRPDLYHAILTQDGVV